MLGDQGRGHGVAAASNVFTVTQGSNCEAKRPGIQRNKNVICLDPDLLPFRYLVKALSFA